MRPSPSVQDNHDRGAGRNPEPCPLSLIVWRLFVVVGFCLTWTPASAASFDCVMDPSLSLKIGSPVSSTLSAVLVKRGDRVVKGQVIARLESAVEETTVALNEARASSLAEISARRIRLEQAAVELNRGHQLLPGNNIPAQKVDELRASWLVAQQDLVQAGQNRRIAEVELERSRALLEQRVIRSPIDGIVVQRLLGPGEHVHQDAHIAVIASIDPIYVEVFPSIRYYGSINEGDRTIVRPQDPVGGERQAVVSVVDRIFDPGSGTFGVRLEMPNPDASVPAGLRCRVTFELPDLPASAGGGGRPARGG